NGAIELVNSQYDNYRSNIRPNWMQFSPRLGLAYQFAHNTVFHAGYGIFFLPNNVAWNYSPNNDPINGFTTPYTASVLTGLPASNISNPFPTGVQQYPGRNPIYQRLLIGQGPTSAQLANPYGYAQQFNADIQHQFGQSFLVDVAYAGSRGVHLPINGHQIDQLPDQYLSLGQQLTTNVPNPIAGIPVSGSLQAATVQAGQLLRPFPQYNGVTFAGQGIGNSTYNSLQVTATKRFSGGNQISVAYTHSKLISDTDTVTGWLEAGGTGGYQDNNNLRLERSLASFDTPDRVVVTYVLDVPVGKGRKFLSNSNGLVQAVLGGWAIQGTTTFQSGFPLHFGTSTNNTHSFGGGSRPNVAAGCESNASGSATQRLAKWFDTGCFSAPAPFTFGNEPRVDPKLRAQGIDNTDFAAVKDFPFGSDGRYRIQFRSEFFNIFNRVQFGPPGQTQGNSNFGVVTSQYNNPRLIQFALRFGF
ncbi:MAG TPA: carboxypeptidase regulatory-like domain-containing protein, partial [Bryobacteraceae bacterium]